MVMLHASFRHATGGQWLVVFRHALRNLRHIGSPCTQGFENLYRRFVSTPGNSLSVQVVILWHPACTIIETSQRCLGVACQHVQTGHRLWGLAQMSNGIAILIQLLISTRCLSQGQVQVAVRTLLAE